MCVSSIFLLYLSRWNILSMWISIVCQWRINIIFAHELTICNDRCCFSLSWHQFLFLKGDVRCLVSVYFLTNWWRRQLSAFCNESRHIHFVFQFPSHLLTYPYTHRHTFLMTQEYEVPLSCLLKWIMIVNALFTRSPLVFEECMRGISILCI